MLWEKLAQTVKYGVRYQDNIIDYTKYHLSENEAQQKSERRVGMGTLAVATMMIDLGIRYGSPESIEFLDKLYKFIAINAYMASIEIAVEKGKFPKCDPELMAQSGFMKQILPELPEEHRRMFFGTGIRNVTILTQAPTGSTGTALDNIPGINASTGIEPYYAFEYFRASRGGGVTKQHMKIAKEYLEENNTDTLPDFFVTAMDLTPEEHVRVQSAVQKWTDSSISKTANAPADYTVEQTKDLYELAYKLGCKGVTIYIDGSRSAQVLSTTEEGAVLETTLEERKLEELKKMENEYDGEYEDYIVDLEVIAPAGPSIKKRPSRLFAFVEKVRYFHGDKAGKAYVTIAMDEEGHPVEVFIECTDVNEKAMGTALGKSITQFLRFGGTTNNVEQIVKHLKNGNTMSSLPFIVGRLLLDTEVGKITLPNAPVKEKKAPVLMKCDSCGENTFDKPNCICYNCGASHCN